MIKLTITHDEPKADDELHISTIAGIVDNAVDHLVVNDSLDYIADRTKNFKILLSKLRINGIIEISGVDIFALSRMIMLIGATIPTINDVLYAGRQSVGSLLSTLDILKHAGITIEIKQLNDDNFTYYVKAKRCLTQ